MSAGAIRSHDYTIIYKCPHHFSTTNFPYTTLFRSRAQPVEKDRHILLLDFPCHHRHHSTTRAWCAAAPVTRAVGISCLPLVRRDRKSTRLNSSHVSISYAVFCLKKKMICTLILYECWCYSLS